MPQLNYRDPDTGVFIPVSSGGPPIGVIVPFAGTTPPFGWLVCDGSAHNSAALQVVLGSPNTPDLRATFVVGAGPTMPVASTGGASTVALTADQVCTPAHTHTASNSSGPTPGSHTHTYTTDSPSHDHATLVSNFLPPSLMPAGAQAVGDARGPTNLTVAAGGHSHPNSTSAADAAHVHTMTLPASTPASGSGHNNLPPYLPMVYIIRAE